MRLESELSGLRTEVASDQNRFENVRQDNSNKFRSIREELKALSMKASFQIDTNELFNDWLYLSGPKT